MKYSSQETLSFLKKLDAALENRKKAKFNDYFPDEKCEVCGTNIHRYIGLKPGVICSTCLEYSHENECVRVMPLAITRSSIRGT